MCVICAVVKSMVSKGIFREAVNEFTVVFPDDFNE